MKKTAGIIFISCSILLNMIFLYKFRYEIKYFARFYKSFDLGGYKVDKKYTELKGSDIIKYLGDPDLIIGKKLVGKEKCFVYYKLFQYNEYCFDIVGNLRSSGSGERKIGVDRIEVQFEKEIPNLEGDKVPHFRNIIGTIVKYFKEPNGIYVNSIHIENNEIVVLVEDAENIKSHSILINGVPEGGADILDDRNIPYKFIFDKNYNLLSCSTNFGHDCEIQKKL